MNTEVVHNNQAAPALTLSLEVLYEREECVLIIVAFENVGVNDASLLTDGADKTYGGPSIILDLKGHTGSLPHP